jgi:hypothetical protein
MVILGRDAFVEVLRRELRLDAKIVSESRLVQDLGFDSLQFLELAVLLVERGAPEFIEVDRRLATVADVYRMYSTATALVEARDVDEGGGSMRG